MRIILDAGATLALRVITLRFLVPALCILLVSVGCNKELCGFTNPAYGCALLNKNENASTAIGVRVYLPRAQLTVDDTGTVSVISKNFGKKTWIVPTQTCASSIQIHEYEGPGAPTGPIVYPPINFICDGDSYPGATLAPGDSMVVKSDLMTILRKARKADNLPLDGQYSISARLKVDDRSVNYAFSVVLTVVPKP